MRFVALSYYGKRCTTTIPFLSWRGEVFINCTKSGTKLFHESKYSDAAINEAEPDNFLTVGKLNF